ncbi:hypothetical protein BU23DRAFT_570395 [Bimuria novae-zelandiae CBS 107.79]|uniref:Uncharacterized protein n=1 Tax=Bimuria novae-zelandiae CBS 107.79 TaxID=1447943 RepID=A0A6A5V2L7_9PLEO|nr:hypothetical protein BU23DRAFT_570395 [Bimuria novae-zelandiae CBS 107.79]
MACGIRPPTRLASLLEERVSSYKIMELPSKRSHSPVRRLCEWKSSGACCKLPLCLKKTRVEWYHPLWLHGDIHRPGLLEKQRRKDGPSLTAYIPMITAHRRPVGRRGLAPPFLLPRRTGLDAYCQPEGLASVVFLIFPIVGRDLGLAELPALAQWFTIRTSSDAALHVVRRPRQVAQEKRYPP